MTGAPYSQQTSPSLKAEVRRQVKHPIESAHTRPWKRRVNGRQKTGRRPTLQSTSHHVLNGVAQAQAPLLLVRWVAAAKVGLDDAAQLKLCGLGEGHGQKRTRTILLPCRMTPPCSLLTLPLELFPPRCRNFVAHATECRTTP